MIKRQNDKVIESFACNQLNSFKRNVSFLYTLKTSENQSFLNVFWRYRDGALA